MKKVKTLRGGGCGADLRMRAVFLCEGAKWSCLLVLNAMLFAVCAVKYRFTASDFHRPNILTFSRDIPAATAEFAAPLWKEWPE